MLYLPDALLVGTFLDILMFAVADGEWLVIGQGVRIENTNIKKGSCMPASPNPLVATSSLTPLSVIAEAPESVSPVTGWNY